MSNPVVNRWGPNSIWYHFWYSDKMYAKQASQDRIFSQLLETYLIYGLETQYSHFSNIYWFRKLKKHYPANSYYRSFIIRKELIGMETKHRVRFAVEDVYRMRTWILRYNKWFIINMYWFQPYKKRVVVGQKVNKVSRNYLSTKANKSSTVYRRLSALTNLTNTNTMLKLSKGVIYSF